MERTYKTPRALEMAVTAAARKAPAETSRAVASFYFDRFLCRVFSEPDSGFVLKGGQSMLARCPDARKTRDVDLLANGNDIDDALSELVRLVSKDLGDYLRFSLKSSRPIKAAEDYRQGLSVVFSVELGSERKDPISVDLVVDEIPCSGIELAQPMERLEIKGLRSFDYRMYSIVDALSDKFCATMQVYEGRPSSRVKDLVDIVVCLTTFEVDGDALRQRIDLETRLRHMPATAEFSVPHAWKSTLSENYRKLVLQTGIDERYRDVTAAEALAKSCFDPLLAGEAIGKSWNPALLRWE